MIKWDVAFQSAALNATDYREFLALFFRPNIFWRNPRPLSFQLFSNRAGFLSKSYMHEIISGRRRITLNSFEKVANGLRLSSSWTEYFRCLVAISEISFQDRRQTSEFYRRKLVAERKKSSSRGRRHMVRFNVENCTIFA